MNNQFQSIKHTKNFILLALFSFLFFSCKKDVQSTGDLTQARAATSSLADKSSAMKVISIIEANDVNPLEHLAFKLKNQNKPLFDIVVLFSANINYDATKKRPYVHLNENLTHVLGNKAKYIKPLQNKGIKVILSILGNHDKSGVANLADATAKQFAQDLKTVCDKYELDGIMLDDEYSKYENPAPIGFVSPSAKAMARLYYEIKLAMPNKINLNYAYSTGANFSGTNSIPEAQAGSYLDYVVNDYQASLPISNFPGLTVDRYAIKSEEFGQGRVISNESTYKDIYNKGHRVHMIFGLNLGKGNFNNSQLPALQKMTKAYYNDELVYDGQSYSKDW